MAVSEVKMLHDELQMVESDVQIVEHAELLLHEMVMDVTVCAMPKS